MGEIPFVSDLILIVCKGEAFLLNLDPMNLETENASPLSPA